MARIRRGVAFSRRKAKATRDVTTGAQTPTAVTREASPRDRRRVVLRLTERGKGLVRVARKGTQSRLALALEALPPAHREQVTLAMQILRPLFIPGKTTAEG